MNTLRSYCHFVAVSVICFFLAGCSILFPSAGITPRTFVLTPVRISTGTTSPVSTNLVVGIRAVKVPGYLSTKAFAVRHGNNEIAYPESLAWAERLDTSLQQVLGADLAALIPTDQVRLSLWDPETVAVQIDINVARFDVDSRGEGALIAWWRMLSSDGQEVFASGRFSATRKGPSPAENAQGAVSTMSGLVADFAGMLAQNIKQHTSL